MINKFAKIYSLAIVILFSGFSYSQSFTASVNNTTVGVGNQFEVDFVYNGKDINGLRNFNPPNFANFLVLSGPNQSTSMQIINGAVSGSLTYSYIMHTTSSWMTVVAVYTWCCKITDPQLTVYY